MTEIMPFLDEVFEADWAQATKYSVDQTYSASDMAIITNTTMRPVQVPDGPTRPYVTPNPRPIAMTGAIQVGCRRRGTVSVLSLVFSLQGICPPFLGLTLYCTHLSIAGLHVARFCV